MSAAVAIVGLACRYGDARSPAELWENVLAQRRAFRRLPDERLPLADYFSADVHAIDRTYVTQAALIEGYEFDRAAYRVAGTTFRSVDMAHWLALDVATAALEDAGLAAGEALPNESTAVLVGNTLTGEFSRASALRLRWPYVERVVDDVLAKHGMSSSDRAALVQQIAEKYKQPFPPVGDETLAGGLSNTIAGRICNYFDLKGGGYTVDGACASSLLAVANGCAALEAGEVDVVLAGGVDLSLDPFELVGFAKIGALAVDEMRVYDERPTGFLPGEGCGFAVLMRFEDAMRAGHRIYAVIRGWGVSSDGHGGITRPETEGQVLALRRAYRRAGFDAASVVCLEGHGTGTAVGDATELEAVLRLRRGGGEPPAAIGSIKANIGHTKAAAGIAGLIKASLAVYHEVLPPATGWSTPHPLLRQPKAKLRLLDEPEPWPQTAPVRAGVSAMGFGGINSHVLIEAVAPRRHRRLGVRTRQIGACVQDGELFLFAGADRAALDARLGQVADYATALSQSELTDLAAELARTLKTGPCRAAVVARHPAELTESIAKLRAALAAGADATVELEAGFCLHTRSVPCRVGYLFPGQGSPGRWEGGLWRRRFDEVRWLYQDTIAREGADTVATEVAQGAIVRAILAGLQVLERVGVEAVVAVGHSLGELAAYAWAGALDHEAALELATARGRVFAQFGAARGAMASIGAERATVESLLGGTSVVVAAVNAPSQTIISGREDEIDLVAARAAARDLPAVRLAVSQAFHSPQVAPVVEPFAKLLAATRFRPLRRRVISTITGRELDDGAQLADLLARQVTSPVHFMDAVRAAEPSVDLWIEVGPGEVLGHIARQLTDAPVISLDVGGKHVRRLLAAAGLLFSRGTPINTRMLTADRFNRPLIVGRPLRFLTNPCAQPAAVAGQREQRNATQMADEPASPARPRESAEGAAGLVDRSLDASAASPPESSPDALTLVRRLVAQRVELPLTSIEADQRLLSDLHLTSLAFAELLVTAAAEMGVRPPPSLSDFGTVTVGGMAKALQHATTEADGRYRDSNPALIDGVDLWVRPFTVELVERPLPSVTSPSRNGPVVSQWKIIGDANDPLCASLAKALSVEPGQGVVFCLPPQTEAEQVEPFLQVASAMQTLPPEACFVLVDQGGGGAAFVRSMHLELRPRATCVVGVPPNHPGAVAWIVSEIAAASGYREAHYDASGTRRVSRLKLLECDEDATPPLDHRDVLLVTGGGKGITAACALSLAIECGPRVAILGRSDPASDAEVTDTLRRFAAAGVEHVYLRADVTDAAAVAGAVRQAEAAFGPVTALLHGAGFNQPQALRFLDEGAMHRTLAPKVNGLQNVLSAVRPERLKLLITFGSLIARTGMPGQADYAMANEWLRRLTERWQTNHPRCRCLCVEWSVWSDVGMGHRLGRIDALASQGIAPISPQAGVAALNRCLRSTHCASSVVVSGRLPPWPTIAFHEAPLPLLRYLEHVRVLVPGVELIAEADLAFETDPYLSDHMIDGVALFPAVMALEAFGQAAVALSGRFEQPVFEEVWFHRPIVISKRAATTIRITALRSLDGRIELALRSGETDFRADHVRATCRPSVSPPGAGEAMAAPLNKATPRPLVLDPRQDLYGRLFFQQGRFRRVSAYRRLRAHGCTADISSAASPRWFGEYLAQEMVLGDAGARDAALHSIQACIPHASILPIGAERIECSRLVVGPWQVRATERQRGGDPAVLVYDFDLVDEQGDVCERWRGVHLRRVREVAVPRQWTAALLAPFLQRRVEELLGCRGVSIVVRRFHRAASHGRQAGNGNGRPRRRDMSHQRRGRHNENAPLPPATRQIRTVNQGDLTVAMAGPGNVEFRAEPVVARSDEAWQQVLAPAGMRLVERISAEAGNDQDVVSARVLASLACLPPGAVLDDASLRVEPQTSDGWLVFHVGQASFATWVGEVNDVDEPLCLAFATEGHHAGV